MRRWFSFFCTTLILLGGTSPIMAAREKVSSSALQRILHRGKICVALIDKDQYPFFMTAPGGRLTGFEIDLARDIAFRLGVKIEFNRKARTFDEVIDIVARKEADIGISNLSATLKRAKQVHFTKPYLVLHNYLLVKRKGRGSLRGLSMDEITRRRDIRILALEGSSHMDFASRIFPLAQIAPVKDTEKAIQAILKNEAFAVYESEDFVKYLFKRSPELYLYLDNLVIEGIRDPIAIAVNWEDLHLLSWLDLYLKIEWPETTIDAILKKYPH
jgi:ABC-type amino acid transport substrate-binding protein